MKRKDAILMIACLVISGCVSSMPPGRPALFSCNKLPEASLDAANVRDRNPYPDYDEAYIVLVRSFYTHGHVRWYHALALGNVFPYKTTVHLEGTIFRSLKGAKQPGEDFSFVETWRIEGYKPVPDNHPVRFTGSGSWAAPTPAIMAMKPKGKGTIVTFGGIGGLQTDVLVQCYQASLHAFVEAQSKYVGSPIDHFAVVPADTPPLTLFRTSLKDVELYSQDCVVRGYAPKFSSIGSQGTTWIYVTQGASNPQHRRSEQR